jgi:hypothetical protein
MDLGTDQLANNVFLAADSWCRQRDGSGPSAAVCGARNSKADLIKQVAANRDQFRLRQSPEQLKKWEAKVSKAKTARFITSLQITQ